jgi:hypothetical protein
LSEPFEWLMLGWLPLGETGGLPFLKRRIAVGSGSRQREQLGGASGGFCRRVEDCEHADGGAIGLVSHCRRHKEVVGSGKGLSAGWLLRRNRSFPAAEGAPLVVTAEIAAGAARGNGGQARRARQRAHGVAALHDGRGFALRAATTAEHARYCFEQETSKPLEPVPCP